MFIIEGDAGSLGGFDLSMVEWILVIYFLLGLLFGTLCAFLAVNKGKGAVGWFTRGLFFNVAALLLLVLVEPSPMRFRPSRWGKVPTTYPPEPCPGCDFENHPLGDECLGCGGEGSPPEEPEVRRAQSPG